MLSIFRMTVAVVLALWSTTAIAGSNTRTMEADQIKSSDKTKTYSLPSATDTLCGIAASQALTNKTIDCSLNTCSNVSATVNWEQEFTTEVCNSSRTIFTITYTPTTNKSVSVYQNGLILSQGSGKEYTISGSTITLATACPTGSTLYVVYNK